MEKRGPFFGVDSAGDFNFRGKAAVGRERAAFGDVGDAGERFDACEKRAIEAGELRGGLIAVAWERQARDEDVIGAKSEVLIA